MRNVEAPIPRSSSCDPPGKSAAQVRYTETQLRRLHVLACAASGLLVEPECMAAQAGDELDPDLRQLAVLARASNLRGDRNYILRRGALLHGDVAVLAPMSMAAPDDGQASAAGPERYRMEIADGQADRSQPVRRPLGDRAHAARLRRFPRGGNRAGPAATRWCASGIAPPPRGCNCARTTTRCTSIARAPAVPADPDILFLSGCQRETYAGKPIQTAVRSAVLPTGVTLDVRAERAELARGGRILPPRARDRAAARGSPDASRPGDRPAGAPRRRGRRAAARGRGADRHRVDLRRRPVPRGRRGGARQSRTRAGGVRTCGRGVAEGAVAAAGAQPARAAATAIAPRHCARSSGCSPWWTTNATSTTTRCGGTTSRRRGTPTICSTRCAGRISRIASDDAPASRGRGARARVCRASAAGRAQQSPAVFSSKVEAVRVDVLVTDNSRAILGLGPSDFELSDNGVPQHVELVSFDQIPLNVILALDMSDSVAGERLEPAAWRRDRAAARRSRRTIRRRSSRSATPCGSRAADDERLRRCAMRSAADTAAA